MSICYLFCLEHTLSETSSWSQCAWSGTRNAGKLLLALPSEANHEKVRPVIFCSYLVFPSLPLSLRVVSPIPKTGSKGFWLFSLIAFTPQTQDLPLVEIFKTKVLLDWKGVLKRQALNSFICLLSCTYSWTCSITGYLLRPTYPLLY